MSEGTIAAAADRERATLEGRGGVGADPRENGRGGRDSRGDD